MASTLDPFIRVVMNMMQRYGATGSLVVTGPGAYNAATLKTEPQVVAHPVKMITMEFIQMSSGVKNRAGSMVKEGDKQVFIQPDETVPVPRPEIDKIIYKGIQHSIVTFKELNPSGDRAVLYELYVRQ